MKVQDLLEAVGEIDEKYINNAGNIRPKTRNRSYLKRGAVVAACLCTIFIVGTVILELLDSYFDNRNNPQPGNDKYAAENQANTDTGAADGVYVPAIELPESSEDAFADMLGLVVCQGHIYTQAEDYLGEDAQKIETLVGEHLGTAKGNIDEWSSRDEYATELASNISGEVYSVKGITKA